MLIRAALTFWKTLGEWCNKKNEKERKTGVERPNEAGKHALVLAPA